MIDSQQLDEDEWLPSTIYLIDSAPKLVEAWTTAFAAFPEVKPILGDYFQRAADAIVSPANSFGIMDGGLDLAIRDRLGHVVQSRLQAIIVEKYHGELPIGCAEIIETSHDRWKYMIAAPTMRIPEPTPTPSTPIWPFGRFSWQPRTSIRLRARGSFSRWSAPGWAQASVACRLSSVPGKC